MDARVIGAIAALYGINTKKEWAADVTGPCLFKPTYNFFDRLDQDFDKIEGERPLSSFLAKYFLSVIRDKVTEEEQRVMEAKVTD
jgi:hypothetical protein